MLKECRYDPDRQGDSAQVDPPKVCYVLPPKPVVVLGKAVMSDVSYTTVCAVTCKFCGSSNVVKNGQRGAVQYYLCRNCHRQFAGNNALPGMRFPPKQIASAVNLFYDGLSIDAIRRQLEGLYHVYPSDSTVYEWIIRFTKLAVKETGELHPKVGDLWVADETVLKMDEGKDVWFWDIIDSKTRFLIASHLSITRGTKDAEELMGLAYLRAGKAPKQVITDKLAAYLDGIELTFGMDTRHRQGGPFDIENNTNLIERFHGTLKARTKVMRGMKNRETAKLIMDGWLVHYNFLRPHEALDGRVPGIVAKAGFKYTSWEDLIIGNSPTGPICVSA